MNSLDQYIGRLDALVQRLSPAQRARLSRDIGRQIRLRNKRRIAANIEPGGSRMAARRSPPGRRLRRGEIPAKETDFLYYGKPVRLRTLKQFGGKISGYDYRTGELQTLRLAGIRIPQQTARSKLMFRKLNQFRFLKLKATSHEAAINFVGGLAARIAAEHHYGSGSAPARELLGFSSDDLALIEQIVTDHVAAAL